MSDLHEVRDPQREPQIDTVGWLFLGFAVAITAAAAMVACRATDTLVANTPVSQIVATWRCSPHSGAPLRALGGALAGWPPAMKNRRLCLHPPKPCRGSKTAPAGLSYCVSGAPLPMDRGHVLQNTANLLAKRQRPDG